MNMDTKTLIALDKAHIWHPFTQAMTAPDAIPVHSAAGAVLTTTDGRQILDLISSWWVNLHGHAHPSIASAVARQAETLEQVIFAGFTHEPAVRLASRLAGILPPPLSRVFFSDNGSTAVEVAMKMALQHVTNRGDGNRTRFLAFCGGYHGDTVGAMSAGVSSNFFHAWKKLLFPVDIMPVARVDSSMDEETINDAEQQALTVLGTHLDQHGETTAAALIEPLVQGACGMQMHRPAFLRAVTSLLQKHGVLVIFDEVMTGFGRTGDLFACLKAEATPDFICLSKGLTGGFLPLSATVTSDAIYQSFLDESVDRAFLHGHSFTANPLGCAAALASLDLLLTDECTAARQRIEAFYRTTLAAVVVQSPLARRFRVTGTIAALDLECTDTGYNPALTPQIRDLFLDAGMLIRPLGNTVYLLPPYCIRNDQLERAAQSIGNVLQTLEKKGGRTMKSMPAFDLF